MYYLVNMVRNRMTVVSQKCMWKVLRSTVYLTAVDGTDDVLWYSGEVDGIFW